MQKVIGVFDSGVGGMTTAAEIQRILPQAKLIYFGDSEHCPYGERTQSELISITTAIVQDLVDRGANLIVIACNTATTQCIKALRDRFSEVIFVGTEPAIKLACNLGCQKILLMATPATVKSQQVQQLIRQNITNQQITLLPCSGLADLIEKSVKVIDGQAHFDCNSEIENKLSELLSQLPDSGSYDGVVLGCTHYIYLRDLLQRYFPAAQIVDGNLGVARRVKQLLS